MRVRLVGSGMIALAMMLAATTARGQQDLDAGKSGAQLFTQDCASCHRSPHGLNRSMSGGALVSFLRQHYTSSANSANLVAGYVLGAAPNPRAERQKGRPGEEPAAHPTPPRERSRVARPAETAPPPAGAPAVQPSVPQAALPRAQDRVARPGDATGPIRQMRRPRRVPPAEPEPVAATEEASQPASAPAPAEAENQRSAASAAASAFTEPLP